MSLTQRGVTCPTCGSVNPAEANFCEHCGSEVAGLDVITVGRGEHCDVILDVPMVSTQHLFITQTPEGYLVRDAGSTNGTFLGEEKQPLTRPQLLEPSALLYLGSYRVTLKRLLHKAGRTNPGDRCFPLGNQPLVLGRNPEAAVVLEHPRISWNHARVCLHNGKPFVEDLGSTNGTFLNGERVSREWLRKGDLLMVGPFLLSYSEAGLVQKANARDFTLELNHVSVRVPSKEEGDKVLLDDISLVVYPGEMCGLMGLAGAGKSTLLKAANGYLRPDAGEVLVNGLNLYEHYDAFRTSVGYVPQEDIFHKDLTVGQALTYAARIRLEDLDEEAISERVDEVLERLAMFEANAQIRNTRISNISGGQKRRLNIAIELLTDPSVFFLDEPTSGLSSEDALIVMSLLRDMAREGKTIILSLHQPSMEIYEMMDNVIYLHKGGRLAYYGPTVPDSLIFTNPELRPDKAHNPEVALRALDKEGAAVWKQRYRSSAYHQEFVSGRMRGAIQSTHEISESDATRPDGLRQWQILNGRNIQVKLNDTMNSLILLLQSPVIASLIALVFAGPPEDAYTSVPTAIYLMVISAIWFGCSNSARDICGEWPIFQRERMYNLVIPSYVLAKFAIGTLISLVQCFVLVMIVSSSCHLEAPFMALVFNLWLTSLAGVALGLFVSAFSSPFKKSNEIAVGLIPIVLLPMVIMGGIIKPFKDMNETAQGVAALTVTRWSFEACLVLEAEHNLGKVQFEQPMGDPIEKIKRDLILERFYDEEQSYSSTGPLWVIGLMCFLFQAATMALLYHRDLV